MSEASKTEGCKEFVAWPTDKWMPLAKNSTNPPSESPTRIYISF